MKLTTKLYKGLVTGICGFATLLSAYGQNAAASRSARAGEVLTSLRSRLPEVARVNGLNQNALEALLRRDAKDLWIDESSRLFYACETLAVSDAEESLQADGTSTTAASAIPNSTDAFKLHSLPGAPRVIYLDFNGHVTSGTSWNSLKTGGADIVSAPFDMDGDPTTFSATERDRITRIWARVAEDYMPFQVDVTTEDPGIEALRKSTSSDNNFGIRMVISPSSAWYGNAGGVAYVGSFQWNSDTPAFVFSDKLGPNGEKYIAEACAHEAGHTLGLNHDGTTDGTAYYSGAGDWAPIMGVGYYKTITQWSKGEYPMANNLQDDIATIASNGAPLAVDDYGNDLGSAAVINGPSVVTLGVIETAADVDVFRFNTGAGTISFNIAGTSSEGDLDVKAEILSSSGAVLASADPAGLAASLSLNVAAGTYYLRVQGVGAGSVSSGGYSDYASVGEYKITGTLIAVSGLQAPTAVITPSATSGVGPLTVSFSSANSSDADGSIVSYSWNFGDGITSAEANPVHTFNQGTYNTALTVTDNTGLSSTATVTITVTAAANKAPTAVVSASSTSGPAPLTVSFSSNGSTDADGSITAYYWDFGDGTNSTAANPSKTYSSVGTFTAKLTVTDDRGANGSASVTITTSASGTSTTQLDVSSLVLTTDKNSAGTMATATVKVLDSNGQPVMGAVVTIQWSGIVTGTGSGTTDHTGSTSISSKRVKKSGTISASVIGVTAPAGYSYNSNLYAAPVVQSVTVAK